MIRIVPVVASRRYCPQHSHHRNPWALKANCATIGSQISATAAKIVLSHTARRSSAGTRDKRRVLAIGSALIVKISNLPETALAEIVAPLIRDQAPEAVGRGTTSRRNSR